MSIKNLVIHDLSHRISKGGAYLFITKAVNFIKKVVSNVKTCIIQKWKTNFTKQLSIKKKLNILNRDLIRIKHHIIVYKKIKYDLLEQIVTLKNEEVEILKFYIQKLETHSSNEIHGEQFVKITANCKDFEEQITQKLIQVKFELQKAQEMITELYKTHKRIFCFITQLNLLHGKELQDEN